MRGCSHDIEQVNMSCLCVFEQWRCFSESGMSERRHAWIEMYPV